MRECSGGLVVQVSGFRNIFLIGQHVPDAGFSLPS